MQRNTIPELLKQGSRLAGSFFLKECLGEHYLQCIISDTASLARHRKDEKRRIILHASFVFGCRLCFSIKGVSPEPERVTTLPVCLVFLSASLRVSFNDHDRRCAIPWKALKE